jgi:hypothetical protein
VPTKAQNKPIPGDLTIGPGYFNAFNNFTNALFILDIPMNNKNSSTDTSVAFAQDAWKTIGGDNIEALELGNEPNSYGKGYDPSQYAQDFQQYSDAIAPALSLSNSEPNFYAGGLANLPSSAWNAYVEYLLNWYEQ